MATENYNPSFLRSGNATADLTGKERYIVFLSTAGTWTLAGANAAGQIKGVLHEGATAGRGVSVCVLGKVKVIAGGTVASAGLSVTTDAAGKVVTATTGQNAIGTSYSAASSNVVFEIELNNHVAL
jgi:hypothetical protein